MNFPIPVNLTVAHNNVPVNITVSDNSESIGLDIETQIVASVASEYEGPYSVTPSESVQTLETDGKLMADNVSVGAIPGNYVGSQVPRKTSADLTASGPTVTAPAGYYAEDATKSVAVGSVRVYDTAIPVTPSISVDNAGKITASVSKVQSVSPSVNAGYVTTGYAGNMNVSGSAELQLSTQTSATITPTESAQTAVPAHKWTTGEVSVAAIPSYYVGSGVTRNDSSDLSVSGDTVTAPSGYYESNASATVQSATWKSASTIGVVPSISVDANGLITATASGWTSCKPLSASGYADADTSANLQLAGSKTSQLDTIGATTYTPSKGTAQTIPLGKFLTGDQTISAIPNSWYDMGGALSWLGAGAELVTTFTLADVKLSATDFNTWTPSTTATDILATRNAGTFTATDAPNWNYFIVWETKIPIVYASAGTNKAKPLFLASIIINAIFRRPSSYDNVMASNYNNTANATAYTGNFLRYYGTTTNSKTYTYNASYGLYGAATAATFSSATADSPTVTAKTPKISARCSTTYMSTANAGYIDKDKTIISQKGYVYKAKRSTFLQGCYEREIAFVNEVDA